jgi:molybdopterin biosynthesis enzyme MoaB
MSHSETDKPQVAEAEVYTASVITVSDRCSHGEREDASGPALVELLGERGYRVVSTRVVPDERPQIEAAIREACSR